jgi:serine/threonine protein kinase
VLERPKYFDNINYKTRIQISRRALSQMILMAAEGLKSLHFSGYVHGDIKPQNMLLSREGVVLIDSLALKEGEVSPGLSPDWAAPEQLLMRPISKSSDIFPLGLMLCAVIGAELTGEYIQYKLPSSGDEPLIVPILRDPILFLPLKEKTLTFAGRKAWFDFIETCLRYDSSQRPTDADAFIIGLKRLCNDYPLEGEVVFEIKSTLLPDLALFPDGSKKPCRIIADRWTSLRRRRINQW